MAHKRSGKWVASGYDKALKRKRHLGTFDTRGEALRAEADWRLRTRATGRETCDQFALRWAADYPRPRASTNKHHHERIQRFAKDFKGVRLADVDRPSARAWALQNTSNHKVVCTMFGDAVRDGIIAMNPFANLRLPQSRGRKDLVVMNETELLEMADIAVHKSMKLAEYGPQYRAMVIFSAYVCLRPGELFALPRGHIQGQLCLIDRSLSKTGEVGPTKNGRSRTVIVPPAAQDALEDVPHHPSGFLFVSPTDRMWNQSSHHRYWDKLRLLAGRPEMAFHELRHTGATFLLERGVTPWDVSIQLGHTDGGDLVTKRYGHPSEAGARARLLAAWDASTGPAVLADKQRSRRAS